MKNLYHLVETLPKLVCNLVHLVDVYLPVARAETRHSRVKEGLQACCDGRPPEGKQKASRCVLLRLT